MINFRIYVASGRSLGWLKNLSWISLVKSKPSTVNGNLFTGLYYDARLVNLDHPDERGGIGCLTSCEQRQVVRGLPSLSEEQPHD